MMKRLKVATTATAVAAALALTGAVGAHADWTNFHVGTQADPTPGSGTMPIEATAGSMRLIVEGGFSLDCQVTFAEGTISTGLFANSGTQVIGNVVPHLDECIGPLGLEFNFECANPPSAETDLAVTSIPTPFTGAVGVEIVNLYCTWELPLIDCTALIEGSVQGSYQNPSGSTPGSLTVFTAGQSLAVTDSECPSIIPEADLTIGEPVGSGVGDITYEVTGDPEDEQPYISPTSGPSPWEGFDVGTVHAPTGGSGSTPVDATADPSRLVIDGAIKLECDVASVAGTVDAGAFGFFGPTVVGNVIPEFDDCLWYESIPFDLECTNPPAGTTDLAVTSIPTSFAGIVGVELVDVSCEVYLPLVDCTALIEGSVPGSYQNPATPSTPASLTVHVDGQGLAVTESECPVFFPEAAVEIGAPAGSGLGLDDLPYELTGDVEEQPFFTPAL